MTTPTIPRLDLDYYGPAMDLFPRSAKFLVFSDDLDEAKEPIRLVCGIL